MVGLAGEGQNFDGNGMYVRFQPGGGPFTVSTGTSTLTGQQLFGNAVVAAARHPAEVPARSRRTTRTSPATGTSSPTSTARPRRSGRPRPCGRATRRTLSRSPQVQGAVPRASGTEGQAAGQGASGQSQGSSGQGKGTSGQSKPSLTDEIVSRLNPFASAGKGGKP